MAYIQQAQNVYIAAEVEVSPEVYILQEVPFFYPTTSFRVPIFDPMFQKMPSAPKFQSQIFLG